MLNLEFFKGDTVSIKINIDDVAIDFTDWIFTFSMKLDKTSETPDLTHSYTATATDNTNRFVVIEIPVSKTKLVEAGRYYYDIQTEQSGIPESTIQTILPLTSEINEDKVIVYEDITSN